MDSSESVHFDFADGTSVAVGSSDYRRVYDELWTLSKEIPGAISTAGLLLNATQHPGYPHAVDLSKAQSAALRRAIDDSKQLRR
jgi:hypothetical protein